VRAVNTQYRRGTLKAAVQAGVFHQPLEGGAIGVDLAAVVSVSAPELSAGRTHAPRGVAPSAWGLLSSHAAFATIPALQFSQIVLARLEPNINCIALLTSIRCLRSARTLKHLPAC
jgi:hypothetical protein